MKTNTNAVNVGKGFMYFDKEAHDKAVNFHCSRVNAYVMHRLVETYPQCAVEYRQAGKARLSEAQRDQVKASVLLAWARVAVQEGLAVPQGGRFTWLADTRMAKALAGWSLKGRAL